MIIPQAGQHVKCFFYNGTLVEGIVEEWLPSYVQLQSLSDQSILVIAHPADDIMMVKIMVGSPTEAAVPPPAPTEPTLIRQQIRTKLKEVERPTTELELQNKSITELRQLALAQEKQIILHKIKEHFPNSPDGSQKMGYASQAVYLSRKIPNGKS